MPTITFKKKDFNHLMGRSLTLAQLDQVWPLVKGEFKEYDEKNDDLKLELNDTNRPDLWCVEGVARQIRFSLGSKMSLYPFFEQGPRSEATVLVDPAIEAIRPFMGGVIVRGLTIDEPTLIGLVQTQEKLSEGFGRKRELVSIGLYRLGEIVFPISYTTADPKETRFVPLGYDDPMSMEEIIHTHPKGIAYRKILASHTKYPLLVDAQKKVLSFPPIINSRQVGEVQVGDRDLFVEVTGVDLRMVVLTINILAVNLADRGGSISPVEVRFPYSTEMGKRVRMPARLSKSFSVNADIFSRVLGEKIPTDRIVSELTKYGYQAKTQGRVIIATVPPYRDDLMHAVDVVEDFAISRGYTSFIPEMPNEFEVGSLSPLETFSDRVRNLLIGMGFQEIISNILVARGDLTRKMILEGQDLVEVENVMSESYSAVRNSIIPSLLRVEAASGKAFYPHRLFEAGEVAMIDPQEEEGTKTLLKLAAFVAYPSASFSEIQSNLDSLFYYLGASYQLKSSSHPSFMEGRIGRIMMDGKDLGLIGEVHPEVLENWGITMPCTLFEIELGGFASLT